MFLVASNSGNVVWMRNMPRWYLSDLECAQGTVSVGSKRVSRLPPFFEVLTSRPSSQKVHTRFPLSQCGRIQLMCTSMYLTIESARRAGQAQVPCNERLRLSLPDFLSLTNPFHVPQNVLSVSLQECPTSRSAGKPASRTHSVNILFSNHRLGSSRHR